MGAPNASPGVLAASASKLVQVEFIDDEDISMGAVLYREYWMNAAAVGHTFADRLYTALWHYDRERKRFGSTRASRVVKPLREISYHAELAHRPAMAMVMKYQQLYAEDIEQNSHKPRNPFKPGQRAA
jgi:hypothetical protein